jgi:M-phase inducer tyrosine phosphatase
VDGVYDALIENYMIIDRRFEYEHNGGHIPGSVNLNTNNAIEEYLLNSDKPMASRSGDGERKTILVFHCEFSVKHAPTLSVPFPPSIDVLTDSMELACILLINSAKHLRSKDRSMNGHIYPKIHYPEVYVLEGGYSQYYSCHPVCHFF